MRDGIARDDRDGSTEGDGPPPAPAESTQARPSPGETAPTIVEGPAPATVPGGTLTHDPTTWSSAPPRDSGPPTIPGYEILGELGRGGMGVVYRARNVLLNRPCAIKMILAGRHADPSSGLRFLVEAEAVARLGHPNIVQIFHVGRSDGLPFFEMEYVPGGSLDAQLDGTPWPASRAARLVSAAARGVAEAHRRETLHRDLKPANILLGGDGTPKITDFGLAKSLAVDAGLTRTDSIMGSPSYMAPEQAEGGKASPVGRPADVYSLGAVLYELLAGRPVFRGATVLETLGQVRTAEPVAPSRLVPGVPRDLETIVLKCLRKDPNRRYPSADALVEDLDRFLDGRTILARRPWPTERAWRWCRRNPAVASLAGLAASLVLAIAVLSSFAAVSLRSQRDEVKTQRDAARESAAALRETARSLEVERGNAREAESAAKAAEATARAERDRSNRLLYASDLRLAEQLWDSDDGPARAVADLLGRHIPTRPGDPDLREFAWRFARTRLDGPATTFRDVPIARSGVLTTGGRTLTLHALGLVRERDPASGRLIAERTLGDARPARLQALSPDGSAVARGGGAVGARVVRIFGAGDGRQRAAIDGPAPPMHLAFSPDGKIVAVLWEGRRATLHDVATGQERGSLAIGPGPVRDLALTRDGKALVLIDFPSSGVVTVQDVATGDAQSTSIGGGTIVAVATSPDGRFAIGDYSGRIRIWNVAARKPEGEPIVTHASNVDSLVFSPDGKLLASGDGDGLVEVREVATRRRVARLKGHTERVLSVAFSGDSKALLSCSLDGSSRLWDLARPVDGPPPVGGDPVARLAFSPDGRTLASGGTRVVIRDPRDGAVVRPLVGKDEANPPRSPTTCLAFSDDGAILAVGTRTSQVVVREVATGRALRSFDGMPDEFYGPPSPRLALSTPASKRVVYSVAIAPGGTILAAGYGNPQAFLGKYRQAIRAWDLRSGGQLATLEVPGSVSSLHFSKDGRTLWSTCHDGTLRSWDVRSWLEVGRWEFLFPINAGVVSPDGRLMVLGLRNGSIVGRDLTTGREAFRSVAHPSSVTAVAFSPDGRTFATFSRRDRSVKFWDAASGDELMGLTPPDPIAHLAFDPGGHRLILGNAAGVRFLSARPLAEIDARIAAEPRRVPQTDRPPVEPDPADPDDPGPPD